MIRPESLRYLAVEQFGRDAFVARMLLSALNFGLIQRLAECESIDRPTLFSAVPADVCGQTVLVDVLRQGGIIEDVPGQSTAVRLTGAFRDILPFLELLHVRLKFAELVAGDFFMQADAWLSSSDEFMSKSKLFEYFDYRRCLEITPENCRHAARWMTLTTVLTRYEASVCCDLVDFRRFRRMLDIGGNSGEFAIQVCERYADLSAEIADLPVVCHVGQEHVKNAGMAPRIGFRVFDLAGEAIPSGFDVITFKSVLHDWPDEIVSDLLTRSFASLPADGTVVIFERRAWDVTQFPLTFGQLPVALFLRSYRTPEFYQRELIRAGFMDINVTQLVLDVPFLVVTARKTA